MNIFLIGFLALNLTSLNCQSWGALGQTTQFETRKVPKDFSYPEARETVKADAPLSVRSLAGKVVDSTNSAIERVLVERLSTGWNKRLDATFTDSNGLFSLPGRSNIQYLKLSKPGFDTLLIRVRINRKAKAKLTLALNPSA